MEKSPAWKIGLKSFLTAYALTAVFHVPLISTHYETKLDYIIATVYELLGEYDFKFLLLLFVGMCFYKYLASKALPKKSASKALSVFFGACLLLGQSYYEVGTWSYCFGSAVNFLKFLLALAGYSILFYGIMELLFSLLDSHSFRSEKEHFFSKKPFLKAFLILLGVYLPFVVLSYPGNLCWDIIGQIEQVITDGGYSTHHPLVHTLFAGRLVQLGKVLFDSYAVGLFIYTILQAVLLAAALSATIAVLAKRGAKFSLLLTLLLLYCVTPVYTNVASTALKDVPFCAFVIGYVICLALLAETPELLKKAKFTTVFVLLQIGVILLRNNGLYVVLLSGIGCFLFLFKKYGIKERMRCFFSAFAGSIIVSRIILLILVQIFNATPGGKGEMLSIPFQQTARYLQLYRDELDSSERDAIEAVLGDVDTIAASYNPKISDPVKALFDKEASGEAILNYGKAWVQGFFKHPAVYADGFLAHIYGWFTPSVSNAIRYEVEYDAISQNGLFPGANKILIFFYRFANRFTPLGVLENIGFAVWALFFLASYQRRKKQSFGTVAQLPLWISLLICMAAPCFFGHPRYAFPILFCLPFLYGFALTHTETAKQ